MLELKLNRKLKAKGEGCIDLQEECAQDLDARRDSQFTLFTEIIKFYAPTVLQDPSYKSQSAQAAYSQAM